MRSVKVLSVFWTLRLFIAIAKASLDEGLSSDDDDSITLIPDIIDHNYRMMGHGRRGLDDMEKPEPSMGPRMGSGMGLRRGRSSRGRERRRDKMSDDDVETTAEPGMQNGVQRHGRHRRNLMDDMNEDDSTVPEMTMMPVPRRRGMGPRRGSGRRMRRRRRMSRRAHGMGKKGKKNMD